MCILSKKINNQVTTLELNQGLLETREDGVHVIKSLDKLTGAVLSSMTDKFFNSNAKDCYEYVAQETGKSENSLADSVRAYRKDVATRQGIAQAKARELEEARLIADKTRREEAEELARVKEEERIAKLDSLSDGAKRELPTKTDKKTETTHPTEHTVEVLDDVPIKAVATEVKKSTMKLRDIECPLDRARAKYKLEGWSDDAVKAGLDIYQNVMHEDVAQLIRPTKQDVIDQVEEIRAERDANRPEKLTIEQVRERDNQRPAPIVRTEDAQLNILISVASKYEHKLRVPTYNKDKSLDKATKADMILALQAQGFSTDDIVRFTKADIKPKSVKEFHQD